jgi:EAL domain-containing protein (putative c-di-GMP-specific phosphodiesterase class I)/GGDEF domain-containing protein
MPSSASDSSRVRELMKANLLVPWFQPLASLQDATVFGYESLIRGPADDPLGMPDALFAAARAEGCAVDLELHCCMAAIRNFVRASRPGRLFLNLSPEAIMAAAGGAWGDVVAATRRFGLLPGRIVIEVTEHERVSDVNGLRDALASYRKAGMWLALDDFGDGHSSLRMWTVLRPELVKVDKHFVAGLHSDNDKFEAVRMLKLLAESFGTTLVAEGIEDMRDLVVARDLSLGYGQGYLLGRPQPYPVEGLPPAVVRKLRERKIAVFPEIKQSVRRSVTAATLLIEAPTAFPAMNNNALAELFRARPTLHAVAVVDDGHPVGIINRQSFLDRYAQPYYKEIFGRRRCSQFMNAAPLVIEKDTPLMNLVDVLRGEDQRYLSDGFVICHEGRYIGLGTGDRLVRGVSELRIEAARHANPLTALPGNIPISEHIGRLLASGVDFAACYYDLNHFKPFNDYYGYWRGDEVIRLAAGIIVAQCDPLSDFVGHVGGDDFVVLMQSPDWHERCLRIVSEFNERAALLYDEAARERGGIEAEDRHGSPRFFPMTSLAIGAVMVGAGDFDRPEDVASAAAFAKRIAKRQDGGLAVCDSQTPGMEEYGAKQGCTGTPAPSEAMALGEAFTS